MRKLRNKIKLTVIIAARNEGDEVTNTIESLFETIGPEVEVILINDHSDTDKFPEPKARPNLKVLHNEIPTYGLFDSIHAAVDIMRADKFFFCNCRCRFTKGWSEVFIKALNRHPQTIFTPTVKVLSYDNTNMQEAKSCYGALVLKQWDERQFKYYQTKAIKNKKDSPVAWFGGMGIDKKWFLDLGGFHPLMTRGGMNVFISLKCWKAGGSVKVLDAEIGNIFRENTSYPVTESDMIYNYMTLAYILYGQNAAFEVADGLKNKRGNEMARHAFMLKFGEVNIERRRMREMKKREIDNLIT